MRRPRVLLVDADRDQHVIVGDYFEHVGYDVDHARSAADGLSRAAAFLPDVIISDWHLPDAPDGAGVRSILATQVLGSRPLVVCSADVFARRRYAGSCLGVRNWLAKPCSPIALLHAVQTAMQG